MFEDWYSTSYVQKHISYLTKDTVSVYYKNKSSYVLWKASQFI